jgi:hypothetical protein
MKTITFFSIGLATVTLLLGYSLALSWPGGAGALLLGLLWLIGQYRRWPQIASLGLAGFVGLAAVGIWQGVPAGWLFVSSVAALVAWDLAHFAQRLEQAEQVAAENRLVQDHLRQLAGVAGLGLLAGGVALTFQLELNLGWAMLLVVLVLIGLGRMLQAIRRASD